MAKIRALLLLAPLFVSFCPLATKSQEAPWFQIPNFALVTDYAPKTWLAKDEPYMPARIEFYTPNMKLVCDGKEVPTDILKMTAEMLPPGYGAPRPGDDDNESRCYITTKDDMTFGPSYPPLIARLPNPYKILPFFKGQTPSATQSVPYYVFVYRHDSFPPERHAFVAQYNMFYPYNEGKQACDFLAPGDNCLGGRISMGNHIADWEAISILFVDYKPYAVHVGAHGNNIPDSASTYWATNWGALQFDGTHPIVYSAYGSHGVYATEGKFNYTTGGNGDELNDYTSKGTLWSPFGSIQDGYGAHVVVGHMGYPADFLLEKYEGRWGNRHLGKSACDIAWAAPNFSCNMLGIPKDDYQLNNGPSMPDRQRDKLFFCCALGIKTANGNYLSATNGGGMAGPSAEPITTNGNGTSDDEIFTLEWVDKASSTFALRTRTGNYVTVLKKGNLLLNAIEVDALFTKDNLKGWETFEFLQVSRDDSTKYRIRTSNGSYLKATNGGGLGEGGTFKQWAVHTDATQRREWETFKFESALDPTDTAESILARRWN